MLVIALQARRAETTSAGGVNRRKTEPKITGPEGGPEGRHTRFTEMPSSAKKCLTALPPHPALSPELFAAKRCEMESQLREQLGGRAKLRIRERQVFEIEGHLVARGNWDTIGVSPKVIAEPIVTRRTNMQQLCAEIRVHHVQTYLLADGWYGVDGQHVDKLFFEKSGDDDEMLRVWIWNSPERSKYASQIQNLLFSLAVLEDREPLDVGNGMVDSVQETTAPPPQQSPMRICIRNDQGEPLRCNIQGVVPVGQNMEPDDALELLFHATPNFVPEIVVTGDGIDVRCLDGSQVELFQGVSSQSENRTVTEIVHHELQVTLLEEAQHRLREVLEPVLTRADFELDVSGEVSVARQVATQRQAAIIATALAKHLPETESSASLVWRVTAQIIAAAELRLKLNSSSIADLFVTASSDNELAPTATAAWLKEFSRGFTLP